jgi:molybdopterin molybdotransferase
VLKALAVEEVFFQVAQRPGRPMWFGVGPRGQLVFGLPGNPVSTLICLQRYVMPALEVAMGRPPRDPERLAVAEAMGGRKMTYFMPVALIPQSDAGTRGQPRPPQGSGDFLALAGTDGFVELPPRPDGYPAGFVADFHRW